VHARHWPARRTAPTRVRMGLVRRTAGGTWPGEPRLKAATGARVQPTKQAGGYRVRSFCAGQCCTQGWWSEAQGVYSPWPGPASAAPHADCPPARGAWALGGDCGDAARGGIRWGRDPGVKLFRTEDAAKGQRLAGARGWVGWRAGAGAKKPEGDPGAPTFSVFARGIFKSAGKKRKRGSRVHGKGSNPPPPIDRVRGNRLLRPPGFSGPHFGVVGGTRRECRWGFQSQKTRGAAPAFLHSAGALGDEGGG